MITLTLSWRRPLSYRNILYTGFYMITASVMKELNEFDIADSVILKNDGQTVRWIFVLTNFKPVFSLKILRGYRKTILTWNGRTIHHRCSKWKIVLRNLAKFTRKHWRLRPPTLLKKRLWHVFPCEFREISKNTLCTKHLPLTASEMG